MKCQRAHSPCTSRIVTMSATCGNSAVFCTFRNIDTCCCVTMSTSTTRSVCWLWWTSIVFRSVWMVGTWCCFTAGTSMIVMRWARGTGVYYTSGTSSTLLMGCACLCIETSITLSVHLRDLHSFLHLLNHKHLALHYHRQVCNLLPTATVTSKI